MRRPCLIRQPAGLGDIILCQKIADVLISNGCEVHWPVIDQYLDSFRNYMQKDYLIFHGEGDSFPLKEYYYSQIATPTSHKDGSLYLPLQYADRSFPGESVLRAKYKILKSDPSGWVNYFHISRNREKENELFYNVLGLKDDMDYSFLNLWYGSPPHSVKKGVTVSSKLPVVEMSRRAGFSIFDWCKVIESAAEIHCVDTGLFYIIEKLDLKSKRLEAYSKFDPSNYMHIEGLFKKPWRYN